MTLLCGLELSRAYRFSRTSSAREPRCEGCRTTSFGAKLDITPQIAAFALRPVCSFFSKPPPSAWICRVSCGSWHGSDSSFLILLLAGAALSVVTSTGAQPHRRGAIHIQQLLAHAVHESARRALGSDDLVAAVGAARRPQLRHDPRLPPERVDRSGHDCLLRVVNRPRVLDLPQPPLHQVRVPARGDQRPDPCRSPRPNRQRRGHDRLQRLRGTGLLVHQHAA